jgi:hypothetical protein
MSRVWTSAPYVLGRTAFLKAFRLGIYGFLAAILLSSCGGSPQGYSGGPETKTAHATETLKPLTLPPSADARPDAPGTTGAQKSPDGLPVLSPKGANTNLFSEKIDNETKRMDRLENAVQELRNDFDAMAPAIVRLVAIEKDIQNLITQLEVLTGNEPAIDTAIPPVSSENLEEPPAPASDSEAALNPPPSAAPQTLPPVAPSPSAQEQVLQNSAAGTPAPTASPSPPPPTQNAAAVQGLRIGEHPDKTRIVLDVRGNTSYTADLDNKEKILVVELAKTGWEAPPQQDFGSAPRLKSYRIEQMEDGSTLLILTVKKDVQIIYESLIENQQGGGGRIVIDLR